MKQDTTKINEAIKNTKRHIKGFMASYEKLQIRYGRLFEAYGKKVQECAELQERVRRQKYTISRLLEEAVDDGNKYEDDVLKECVVIATKRLNTKATIMKRYQKAKEENRMLRKKIELMKKQATNDKMLEVIKKIALAKKESKKAYNQIAAYEYEQDIKKLTDELVALHEEQELK